jgi:hypothetical protein
VAVALSIHSLSPSESLPLVKAVTAGSAPPQPENCLNHNVEEKTRRARHECDHKAESDREVKGESLHINHPAHNEVPHHNVSPVLWDFIRQSNDYPVFSSKTLMKISIKIFE